MTELDVQPLSILYDQLEEITRGLIAQAPNLFAALVLILLTWGVSRLARYGFRRGLSRSSIRPSLRVAVVTLIGVVIWIAGLMIAAMVALPGLTPASLLAGLGIGSIAVGLAFKDIFENFLAGLLIMLRKPMRLNDFIECEGISGRVEQISIRDTFVRRTDGVLVLLPNAFLFKNPVRVLTDRDRRRQTITVGVAYGENIAESREVIEGALEGLETVDHNEPIQVFAEAFGASSIDFEVTWWTGSKPVDQRRSRDEVVDAIKVALDGAGIEIPFPYRTLTFAEPLPMRQVEDKDNMKETADA